MIGLLTSWIGATIRIIFNLPFVILFWSIWILYYTTYPFIITTLVISVCTNHPFHVLAKLQLIWNSLLYMVLCRDKNYSKKGPDPIESFPAEYHLYKGISTSTNNRANAPDTDDVNAHKISSKLVIFVRHGESTWNDTFNKGPHRKTLPFIWNFIPNLIYALYMEWYYYVTGQYHDSWFYDSSLSPLGIQQGQKIQQYLNTKSQFLLHKEAKLLSLLNYRYNSPTTSRTSTPTNSAATIKTTNIGNRDNENPNEGTSEEKDKPNSTAEPKVIISQLVSSNLRRAISTIAIGFHDRIVRENNKTTSSWNNIEIASNTNTINDNDNHNESKVVDDRYRDTIIILPCLQEISTNPDALCITPPYRNVRPSSTDPYDIKSFYASTSHNNNTKTNNIINVQSHTGNKSLFGTGLQRLQRFCDEVFYRHPQLINVDCVIVGGHSLWFKEFFKWYLPKSFEHVCKKKKMTNGSIVVFTLLCYDANANEISSSVNESAKDDPASRHYMIDPTSIVVLHGGF